MQGNILIVGCGDIGIPLARHLTANGASVWGLRRQPWLLPDDIHPLAADVTVPESLSVLNSVAFDYVVMTLTPSNITEEGYRRVFVDGVGHLLRQLQQQPHLKRIFHVSSTSVYHQSQGEWVDENSATQPTGFSGQCLLAAEQLLLAADWPATMVRFAGIYGPGRRRLIEQVLAGRGSPRQPPLYTNRIHRDDCVGVLAHLLQLEQAQITLDSVYIGVDSEPVTLWEVKQWLAAQLGVMLNECGESDNHRRGSKRCSNRRLLACGYSLIYPGFRQGYASLLL